MGRTYLFCNFCEKGIKGGGINRMKMNVVGQSGDVTRCKKVSNDVCFRMNESLKEIAQQKLERRMNREEETLLGHPQPKFHFLELRPATSA